MKTQNPPVSVQDYIDSFPEEIRAKLVDLRRIIHETAPEAEEKISYGMPAFFLNGVLVYFAGCKNHIGFYPTGIGVDRFLPKLEGFKHSKGAIRFPLEESLPRELIIEIVEFRKRENLEKKNIGRKTQ